MDRPDRRDVFVRHRELSLAQQLDARLRASEKQVDPLPGIRAIANRESFIEQLVESVRRIRYISVIKKQRLSALRADPSSDLFDPLRAAVLRQNQEQIDEAFWLVFLFVHFGKNRRTGWRLVRDVYGALGDASRWDWTRTSSDPRGFRQWLGKHQTVLQGGDGIARHFGNHRKYESLDAQSDRGTGAAVESYVRWVRRPKAHLVLVQHAQQQANGDPRKTFDYLYHSMNEVERFGRTAKFDYLTMVGKLGLAPIEPGSAYMRGATGPLAGARLLFGGSNQSASVLDQRLVQLEAQLSLDFGMQVLEDALCNWQKSPGKFRPFRG